MVRTRVLEEKGVRTGKSKPDDGRTASTHERGGAWNPSDGNREKADGEHCLPDSTESHRGDKALGVSARSSVD